MLIDCALVADEWDMLTLRVLTLRDVVDAFVVVRCTHTHQGQPAAMEPMPDYFDRISYGKITERVFTSDLSLIDKQGTRWERPPDERGPTHTVWFQAVEKQHRDACADAARTIADDPTALVCVSDVDEIPDAFGLASFAKFAAGRDPLGWWTFAMRMHSTALDYLHPQTTWHGTCVTTLAELEPQAMRDARTTIDMKTPTIGIIANLGSSVHLSWFGSDAERSRKLTTFSHAEIALRGEDPAQWRRDGVHANGEKLVRCDFPGDLAWPKPLTDGSFVPIPESWRA